jgi:protein TonB
MEPRARVWCFAFSISLGVHAGGITALALMPRQSPPRVQLPDGSAEGIRVILLPVETTAQLVAQTDHETTTPEPLVAEEISDGQSELAASLPPAHPEESAMELDAEIGPMQVGDDLPHLTISSEVATDRETSTELPPKSSSHEPLNNIEEQWKKATRVANDIGRRIDAVVHRLAMMGQAALASGAAAAAPAAKAGSEDAGVSQGPSPLATNRPPEYPEDARRRRQMGTVIVRVVVLSDGLVSEAVIVQSSGFDSLDDAAIVAVRSWRFVPAVVDGRPVQCEATVPVEFILRSAAQG